MASCGVPVVSSGVLKVPQCCSSGVLVASRASWVLVVFHPSGVPVVSGVPRGGVSENLRLRGGWCSAGEVVGGVAVGRCRSVIRSVF